LFQTERKWINSNGLPNRPWYKHLLQASGIIYGYGAEVFPSLMEAIRGRSWQSANNQVTLLASTINSVADFMIATSEDRSNEWTTGEILIVVLVSVLLFTAITCVGYRYMCKKNPAALGDQPGRSGENYSTLRE